MSQPTSQDSTRCVVAYDHTKGTILAVHFLPSGQLPEYLTDEHLHEITRSHAATRSGLHLDSIATLTADAAEFTPGARLHIDPASGQILKTASAAHAEFGGGAGSSAK
jgi:hypothetical protein